MAYNGKVTAGFDIRPDNCALTDIDIDHDSILVTNSACRPFPAGVDIRRDNHALTDIDLDSDLDIDLDLLVTTSAC